MKNCTFCGKEDTSFFGGFKGIHLWAPAILPHGDHGKLKGEAGDTLFCGWSCMVNWVVGVAND